MAIAFRLDNPKTDQPFDIDWMSQIPTLDSRGYLTETGPGFTVSPPQIYSYFAPAKLAGSPLWAFNNVVDYLNARLTGPYINSESLVNIDAGRDFILPRLSRSRPFLKSDMLLWRDALRTLNPHVVFQNLPRVWSSSTIMDLLQLRWVRRVDSYTRSTGQLFSFYAVSQLSGAVVSSCPATAIYEFNMGTGLGSQLYYWLAPDPPTPDKLLARWAVEDAPKNGAPQSRGKLTATQIDGGFIIAIPTGNQFVRSNAQAIFQFTSGVGGITGGTPGANIQDGDSTEGGNGGGEGRD